MRRRVQRQAVHAPRKQQELLARQPLVEVGLLGEHAGPALDLQRLPGQLVARHADAPGVRPQQAAQQLDGGRLAGAVRAEKAEKLAFPHPQADAIDRDRRPEALHQTGGSDALVVALVRFHGRLSRR